MGTNKLASQKGMTSYGTRRLLFDSKISMDAIDQSTISLQMGTNKGANQVRGTPPMGVSRCSLYSLSFSLFVKKSIYILIR